MMLQRKFHVVFGLGRAMFCMLTLLTSATGVVFAQNVTQFSEVEQVITDKAQQLFCKILPQELLNELNAAKKTGAGVSNYAKIFAKYIQSADPLYYTAGQVYETPLRAHYVLANLFHDLQAAVGLMQQNMPISLASLLEGLSKIYAHEATQQYAKFKEKVNNAKKTTYAALCEAYKDDKKKREYFGDIFYSFINVVLATLQRSENTTFVFDYEQNSKPDTLNYCDSPDHLGIRSGILGCIPVTIFKEMVLTNDCKPTNREHWQQYLEQCFLFSKLSPQTSYIIASLYFGTENFLKLLVAKKQSTLALLYIFTEFLALRQYAVTATAVYWDKLLQYAKYNTPSDHRFDPGLIDQFCHLIDVSTDGAILPLPKMH